MAGRTPDEFPGERIEDTILLLSGAYVPSKIGEIAYVSGSGFQFLQDDGIHTLSTGSVDPLAIEVTQTSFDDVLYGSDGMLSMSIYTDNTRASKIQDYQITYGTNRLISAITSSAYTAPNTLVSKVIEVPVYDSFKRITSIFRTKVV